MYGLKGEVPDTEDFTIPLGVADVKREGSDCTIVARSFTVPQALKAAEQIQAEFDVSVEVVDPRTIKPLDIDTIVESIKKTNRLVIAEESHSFASVGAEITYQVMDTAFDYLDAPIKRISTVEAPMPYAKNLEDLALPSVGKIVDAVKEVCYL
jgi:pyruvate dehydrogenase E1 component beta subunit